MKKITKITSKINIKYFYFLAFAIIIFVAGTFFSLSDVRIQMDVDKLKLENTELSQKYEAELNETTGKYTRDLAQIKEEAEKRYQELTSTKQAEIDALKAECEIKTKKLDEIMQVLGVGGLNSKISELEKQIEGLR